MNYIFGKVIRGLVDKEKFSIQEMKKTINKKMPMFSGYDQHDSQ
jgi:hypothetical protein